MRQRSKWYLIEFFIVLFVVLGIVGKYVVKIDPFFTIINPIQKILLYTQQ